MLPETSFSNISFVARLQKYSDTGSVLLPARMLLTKMRFSVQVIEDNNF